MKQNNPQAKGFTLIEIMVALAILVGMSLILFQSMDSLIDSGLEVVAIDEINQTGVLSLNKIYADLQSAFIKKASTATTNTANLVKYAFMGKPDRLDFNAFAHYRYFIEDLSGEIAEVGYYLKPDDEHKGAFYLIRRESTNLDNKPDEGGKEEILAENVKSLSFEYYDAVNKEYKNIWDTMTGSIQSRLPRAVKIKLVLFASTSSEEAMSNSENESVFVTTVPLALFEGALE